MSYWDDIQHHTDTTAIWMAHPLVRAAINRRVSGDPAVWPTTALGRLLKDRPLRNTLSIGCGTGGLERTLLEEKIVERVTGIDASASAIDEARRLGPHIDYVVGDPREFVQGKTFDAIFFHQSLHHFDQLDDLMVRIREALVPGGLLYIDEYVGPSRDEWLAWRLIVPNLAYRLLPLGTRRAKIVRAPINHEDPTEAIRSSQIVGAVQRHFRVPHRRDYGGNLLALLYPNMQPASRRFDEAVARLIAMEERLLAMGARSFYTIMLAEKVA